LVELADERCSAVETEPKRQLTDELNELVKREIDKDLAHAYKLTSVFAKIIAHVARAVIESKMNRNLEKVNVFDMNTLITG
jgi:hypothetical protein